MNALLFLALAQPVPIAPLPREVDPFRKWEKDVAAIETRLKLNPPKPGAIFFAGSSSIVQWDLPKSFPDLQTVKVGFGGSQVRDSTHFAARILTPHKPATIVFYAGDNDLNGGRKPEQVADDFKLFCATVHKDSPKTRILFISVKPSLARWAQIEKQTKSNTLVKEFCASDSRLGYIDVVPLMIGPDGKPIPDYFVKDGLHMTPAGYETWNAAVRQALK
jgi:lysophospholipase L1-like esterase